VPRDSDPTKTTLARPASYAKDRPVLSSERTAHKKKLSKNNKYLVMRPRWGSTPRLTD
jgi:hypothetical protein